MTIDDIEKLKGVHKHGCSGSPCTCGVAKKWDDAIESAKILQFPQPEIKIEKTKSILGLTVNEVLQEVMLENLDLVMVLGYKGDNLFICSTGYGNNPKARELMKKAAELLRQL